MAAECVYLGERTERLWNDKLPIWKCHLHGECVTRTIRNTTQPCSACGVQEPVLASCRSCKDRISKGFDKVPEEWRDPLIVTDRDRNRVECLRNMLAGRAAFLFCGGPSANQFELEKLNDRGMWTLCVNNAAGHARFKPQAMIFSDPPLKFTASVWRDPGIMKFCPIPKLSRGRAAILEKRDGEFYKLKQRTFECPNTWGFGRRSWIQLDDTFFLDQDAAWGNHRDGVQRTGGKKTVCTMLLGMRLLRYLGARQVFLVGVDFRMSPSWGYSWNQARDEGASRSNNQQYGVVNEWLCELQNKGVFGRFGIEFYNCYKNSGLRAFPHCPFDKAVEIVRGSVEKEPDLEGWYEKAGWYELNGKYHKNKR